MFLPFGLFPFILTADPLQLHEDLGDNVFLVVELTGIGTETIIVYFHVLVNYYLEI